MKTPMQELIETFLSIKNRTPQKLHFEKGLHAALDSCINEAKSMLEKEKDMFEDIIDIIDSENSGQSAEQRLDEIKECIKTFNTKEK